MGKLGGGCLRGLCRMGNPTKGRVKLRITPQASFLEDLLRDRLLSTGYVAEVSQCAENASRHSAFSSIRQGALNLDVGS